MGIDQDHAAAGGIQMVDGDWEWCNGNGELHRTNGPAVIRADGTREWWYLGQRHRINGPAWVSADGHQAWWFHGQRHRINGPAITRADDRQGWYVQDRNITAEVEAWMRERGTTWPFTAEQQAEFLLRWS